MMVVPAIALKVYSALASAQAKAGEFGQAKHNIELAAKNTSRFVDYGSIAKTCFDILENLEAA